MTHAEPGAATSPVQLRTVIDADLPIFFEHQRDPVATRMADFPAREWDAFQAHWAKTRADPANILLTILVNGQVAGNLGSWEHDGERELGYWLGRAYWGRGIATQAVAAFLRQVPVRPLYAYVAQHNIGSRRVLEKNGFIIYGEEPGEVNADGEQIPGWLLILRPPEAAAPLSTGPLAPRDQ